MPPPLNATRLSGAAVANDSPTIVTMAPAVPPGGFRKAIRGPPGTAMRVPLKVPPALLPSCVHEPVAVPSTTLTAVSVQRLSWQGVLS